MALPNSGILSLQDIAGEFGGSVPHGLQEYYGVASGIPASGEIGIQDFYGASAFSVVGATAKANLGSSIALPLGTAVGDFCILACYSLYSVDVSLYEPVNMQGLTERYTNYPLQGLQAVWAGVLTGTSTINLNSSGNRGAYVCITISGSSWEAMETYGPYNVHWGVEPDPPDLKDFVSGDICIALAGTGDANNGNFNSAPTGFTLGANAFNSNGGDTAMGVAYKNSAGGTEDPGRFGNDNGGFPYPMGVTIRIVAA